MYKKALVTGGEALGGEIARYLAGQGYDIALAHGAGGVIVAIPVTILFMCLQRYYVEGVTGGAVKG